MPRSATDATRFTSTTPHASAKPPYSASIAPKTSSLPSRKPGPPGETPQEKVRRLRAAADRARDAQITTFDRLLVRGRVWADRAHRFTALSLIGATVVAGGVTVYALGDMMIYNRRKRAQFYKEQKALKENAIHSARLAIESGMATEAQIDFIRIQDEHQAQLDADAKAKAAKRGLFGRGKDWLFSGLKNEEEGDDVGTSERRLGYEALSEEDDSMGERESDILRAIEEKKLALEAKAKQAFAEEKERQRKGGPLDRIGPAENGDDDGRSKSGVGWTSFMTRR